MSAYRIAILQTITTIDNRACYFRNLVVAVVVLTLAFIGWAAVTGTFSPLVGLLLLLPAYGVFFFLDAKLLNDWRAQLLDAWVRKEIEFRAFCDAVSAIPTLPKDTLHSMLTTLPSAGDLPAEQGSSSSSTREAAAALTTTMHACESDAMALKATGLAISSGSLIIAVILWMWQPILGITILAWFPFTRKWLSRRRLQVLREKTAAARAKPDFNSVKYSELVANLARQPISPAEKRAFFTNSIICEQSPHVYT
jgi:hypothetical protein